MTGLTRREWGGLVVGGLVASPWARLLADPRQKSIYAGVRLGAQSYSFRDRGLDAVIAAMADIGLSYCELWSNHVEHYAPIGRERTRAEREAARKWRLEVPLDYFRDIRRKFDTAGIILTAYNLSFEGDFTDDEIARGFEMARALGVQVITTSSDVAIAARLDPLAQHHKMTVAFHNHSDPKEYQVVSPDDFDRALNGRSKYLAINLDIGHFTAANHDAVAFLDAHHDRIVSLHIKDRKRNQGEYVPFGQGDTPIAAVLTRLRDRKWNIPAQIEYEYRGQDTVAEVRRSLEFCRRALEAS